MYLAQGYNTATLVSIMQTCPFHESPLTPHFYIVIPGLTGVFIFSSLLCMAGDIGCHCKSLDSTYVERPTEIRSRIQSIYRGLDKSIWSKDSLGLSACLISN